MSRWQFGARACLALAAMFDRFYPFVNTTSNVRLVRNTVARCACFAVALFFAGQPASAQTISTIAGGGIGDTGPALNATFEGGGGQMAHDSHGNVYFADLGRVRKVSTDGTISTFAGTGTTGFSGDGGLAKNARLGARFDLFIDASDNIYVVDQDNNRLRKIDTAGVITTIAGGGTGGDGGLAVNAYLNAPTKGAIDSDGNIYLAVDDHYIKRISGGVITAFAGNGYSSGSTSDGPDAKLVSLGCECFLAVDHDNNLLISDWSQGRVYRVTPAGAIATVAGGGLSADLSDGVPATSIKLSDPAGVAVTSDGSIIFSDYFHCLVRRISTTGLISTIAGNGTSLSTGDGGLATEAGIEYPAALSVNADGTVLVSNHSPGVVRKFTIGGNISTFAGAPLPADGISALESHLGNPNGIAFDSAGNAFIADQARHIVRKLTADGKLYTVAGTGVTGFAGDGGSALGATLTRPKAVALDSAGNLFISDSGNYRIRKVATNGTITTVAGNGTSYFTGTSSDATTVGIGAATGMAVDSSGNLLFVTGSCRVFRLSPTGVLDTVAGAGCSSSDFGDGGPATSATFNYPGSIAIAADGNVFVGDYGVSLIRKFKVGGTIQTIAGAGAGPGLGDGGPAVASLLHAPLSLAFDSAGNLYIGTDGDRIRKISTDGLISTVAGTGVSGFSGDGGPPQSAKISGAAGMAVSTSSELYFSDIRNGRVRKFSTAASSATVPGAPTAVVAKSLDGGATVDFSAPASDGGSAINGYRVVSFPAGGVDVDEAKVALTHRISGLTNGTSYTFKVYALNPVGSSAPSASSNAVIPQPNPVLSVSNESLVEGDSGSKSMVFRLALSHASDRDVTFYIETKGPLFSAGPSILPLAKHQVMIAAGDVELDVPVTIYGDLIPEGDVDFQLIASNIVNADPPSSSYAYTYGTGVIIDDDNSKVTIGGVSVLEGNSGTHNVAVTVSIYPAASHDVTMTVSTGDGTAIAGSDYIAVNLDNFTIPAGSPSATFDVQVIGDVNSELDEYFYVNASNVVGAKSYVDPGFVNILNDDGKSAYPPAAALDEYSAHKDEILSVDALHGVLANDVDPTGAALKASLNVSPGHGSITLSSDGSFTYSPATGFVGSDAFKYQVCNTLSKCAIGQVLITVGDLATVDRFAWIVPSAANAREQGFLRLQNASTASQVVIVHGHRADGTSSIGQFVRVVLAPGESRQLNSDDLEFGNEAKGLEGSIGTGNGDWVVEVNAAPDVEVLSYIRTVDGYLTPVGDTAPLISPNTWLVPIFNPALNTNQTSHLRLVNPSASTVTFSLHGRADNGAEGASSVEGSVIAGGALDITATDLESGNSAKGLAGHFGTGSGKWQIEVSASAPLAVQTLLYDPNGYVTDLSTLPDLTETAGGERILGFVPPASSAQQQGFVRLLNRGVAQASIAIWGFDDRGVRSPGQITLYLDAGKALQLNSQDLESGNAAKGIVGSLGQGTGNWRLMILSDSEEVLPMAYIRTPDGFLTSVHDTVAEVERSWSVRTFNPAANVNQVSSLRLINPGSTTATISIQGTDDLGIRAPGGSLALTLAAGQAIELTASDLESGNLDKGLVGALGVGSGKWTLNVVADQSIKVMSLLRDPTGHIANLSNRTKDVSDRYP